MKKIFNSRALALILVLAMAVSLFTISASAATTESLEWTRQQHFYHYCNRRKL